MSVTEMIYFPDPDKTIAVTPKAQTISLLPNGSQTEEYVLLYKTEKSKKPFAAVPLSLIMHAVMRDGMIGLDRDDLEDLSDGELPF